jgi:hypothetical protein
MSKRLKAIIAKTRMEQSIETAILNETRKSLKQLKQRQDNLSLKEALIIGAGGLSASEGILTGRQLSSAAGYAEKQRKALKEISNEYSAIEMDSAKMHSKLATIQEKLAVKSRLLDQLAKMK